MDRRKLQHFIGTVRFPENPAAIRLSREVLGFRGKVLPDQHPITASALQVLGMSLTRKGDAKSAESFLRESLGLRLKALPGQRIGLFL